MRSASHLAGILAIAFAFGASASANATEWIYCSDPEATVDIGFLLGSVDAFMPAGATLRYKTQHWTTNEAYGDGALMTVGQGFSDKTMLIVDLYDEGVNSSLAELRVWKAEEGDLTVHAGTLRIPGQGAWVVSCDPA